MAFFARALACAAAATVATASGGEVLHEYIPPDPTEDLRLGATSTDGTMAAAIQTQSGAVAAPDSESRESPNGAVYGGKPADRSTAFHIDSDTRRPTSVSYSDPFTPAVAPYKREFAYDAVNDALELVVHDPTLAPLPQGGVPRNEDDQFYADLEVDLVSGQPVRIPTVGPSARIIAARSDPPRKLEFLHDGADNWFLRGSDDGRIRLVLHLAVDRAVFGSAFADVDWARLYRFVPALPENVKSEGIRVARQIGVVEGTSPAESLRLLVKYFREFTPSTERPKSSGLALYHELAITQKGVCRHRAYAFVVTALALGIPARFVRNEAHAWVEVSDTYRWHRIDLGGAADEVDFPDEARIAHVPPRDPFEWPTTSDSGQAMADRARSGHGARRSGAQPSGVGSPSASLVPPPAQDAEANDGRPKSEVSVEGEGGEVRRGGRLRVTGRVESRGSGCGQARVDLFLEPEAGRGERVPLGTLVTTDEGRYDGRVVVPFAVPPGEYDVRASTPGNLACGQGQSR